LGTGEVFFEKVRMISEMMPSCGSLVTGCMYPYKSSEVTAFGLRHETSVRPPPSLSSV
jgi:hypothetical protein